MNLHCKGISGPCQGRAWAVLSVILYEVIHIRPGPGRRQYLTRSCEVSNMTLISVD